MAKIAIDARIIYTSTGRYVERLLEYLQQIDTTNEYIVLLMDADFDRWQPQAPNFTKIAANYPMYSLPEQFGFARLLYGLNADIVHFTMPQHPLLYLKKKVITVHDLTLIDYVNRRDDTGLKAFYRYTLKPLIFRIMMKNVIKSADHVITPTMYVENQVVTRLGVLPERVTQTYEASEVWLQGQEPVTKLAHKKFVLYVGNAFPYKNLRTLVDASLKLPAGYSLALAGKPEYFYLELEAYARSIQAPVDFLGFVSDEQLGWLYKHAKLYVFPSLSEGFGLPGLEALAHGLPMACSTASCLPEVYGSAAVYFDPQDSNDIARTVSETLADKKQLAHLKAAGLAHAKTFSWKRMAEQTLDVYEKLTKPA